MNAKRPCPSPDQLERLLLGAMLVEEMEILQGHVAGCGSCLETIRKVTTEDALILAVRAGGRVENISPEDANPTLLARLRRLYPAAKSTAPLFGETLVPAPDKAEELIGLLQPPGEPDELGHFGPYGILRSLGSGGMGVVFAARQTQPRRVVALKMILAASHDGRQRLARFQSETEIIAQLQHPNIVPVYEVGEHGGRPYYTMEYLDGGSLAQKLAAVPLAPRAAAELSLLLARAIHFAHEHGIVHRDLKPANVLLALDGTPKIADFGLAKQLGSEPGEPAPYRTESGAILGTPGYMAPEQIESSTEVGPASDVYALGAILYECLTGRPPFKAANVLETLEQVRSQEPVPISRLQPKVPRDLQTICLTCLHKQPGRRYGSAATLAEDLGRFLRGEPIQARPVSARERLWKWARRKPALAVLLAVCGLLLTALIVGGLVYNARLRAAVERAEDKEAETQRQYRQAHDTLDRMLGRVESPRLAEVPQLKELQRSLLEDALAFYQVVLQRADSPDPRVRRDAAVACRRAADIQQMLGQFDAAAENYRRVIELTESLPAEDRDSPEIQVLQAGSYMNWGTIVRGSGRVKEAEQHNRAALERFERLVQERPDDPTLLNELAKAEHNRGLLFIKENPAEAESHYRRSAAIRTALVRDHPEEESYQASLAADYQDLGLLYKQTNRLAEAAALYPKAEALLRPLVDRHPAKRKYVLTLAILYVNWSYDLARAGRSQEALERLDFAVRLAEDAHRREPKDEAVRWQALQTHGARAEIREFVGRFADSVKDWDRVIELEEEPNRSRWRRTRARVLTRAGDHARAVAEADELAALPDATEKSYYFLAGVYSQAIAPALSDKWLSATRQKRLAERYAAQAIALLRKLQNQGYFQDAGHAKALRTDEALQPLRAREDFRRLLAAVESK
jgi:eukaryotic-like serine/threonine-protein kinase